MFGAPRDGPVKIRKCRWTREELDRYSNGAWPAQKKDQHSLGMLQLKALVEEQRTPSTDAPFPNLPAELRNEIYRHYFCGQTWYVRPKSARYRIPNFGPKGSCPGLLLASRQAYHEAEKFRYSHGRILINNRSHFEDWVIESPLGRLQCITQLDYRLSLHWPYSRLFGRPDGGILEKMPNLQEIRFHIRSESLMCRYVLSAADNHQLSAFGFGENNAGTPRDLLQILLDRPLRNIPWMTRLRDYPFPRGIVIKVPSEPCRFAYLVPVGQPQRYEADSDQDIPRTSRNLADRTFGLCIMDSN